MGKIILVTGPTASGKSIWAESLIKPYSFVTYVASAPIVENDHDWQNRVEKHQKRRPGSWELCEPGLDLLKHMEEIPDSNSILIDSLGGFICNHLGVTNLQWLKKSAKFINIIKTRMNTTIIVIEQVGWGVVPSTDHGNLFRDRLGQLALELERYSSDSWLVIQGRAINLKLNSIAIQ